MTPEKCPKTASKQSDKTVWEYIVLLKSGIGFSKNSPEKKLSEIVKIKGGFGGKYLVT